jgi:hypothetical protein
MNKWEELKGAIGRQLMPEKRRNPQAVAAWSRHQGSHSPGTKRPDVDETEEGLEDALEDALEAMSKEQEEALRTLIEELEEDDREED